jgi:hypothetical protein
LSAKKSILTLLGGLPKPIVHVMELAAWSSSKLSGAVLPGCGKMVFVPLKNSTVRIPLGSRVKGAVGEPVRWMPDTDWPANVCAKLPPGAVIKVPVVAPLKSMFIAQAAGAQAIMSAM